MENIQLEGRKIEQHYGEMTDTAPALLARYEKGEGVILSEADIRLLSVRNFKNAPQLAKGYLDASTLSATKEKIVKVILPYETDSGKLTKASRFGLSLINPNEKLVDNGVNLDIDGRWEKLKGSGVYSRLREDWFDIDEADFLIGLNSNMTEEQANKCPLLLTKLGHPGYVDYKFAKSADEVAEIIGKTFELGKQEYGYDIMMAQYLPDIIDNGVLKLWHVDALDTNSRSVAWSGLDYEDGLLSFGSVGDAKSDAKSVVPKYTEIYSLSKIKRVLKKKGLTGIEDILASGLRE